MAATIELSATEVVIDEVVTISVNGLQPDHAVTVRASMAMADRWCSSHASFVPGVDGSVDLSVLAPVTGTYSGVDPMGLFWSLGPDRRPPPRADDRGSVIVVAEVDGREVARAGLTQRWATREVQVLPVRQRGLIGELFWEPDQPRRPAVVVFGGSEGGLSGWGRVIAAGLASDGYTALLLAYFGIEGLPRHLSLIPIEYFECALDWLGERAGVDSERLGVVGASRGGELALSSALRSRASER